MVNELVFGSFYGEGIAPGTPTLQIGCWIKFRARTLKLGRYVARGRWELPSNTKREPILLGGFRTNRRQPKSSLLSHRGWPLSKATPTSGRCRGYGTALLSTSSAEGRQGGLNMFLFG